MPSQVGPTAGAGDGLIRVASAPVSFGVFELTIGRMANLPGPEEILDAVSAAGFDGIDLGPLGYLGEGRLLNDRLLGRGLRLAGGYVQLRLSEPDVLEEDLEVLDRTLDVFVAAAGESGDKPKPTLADAGSPARVSNPGRGRDLPEIGLDEKGWSRLADGVNRAAERCRDGGFEPTFHHHAGTHVEAPHEIERLLALTDVGLCLDTGHLLLGGGDPVRALRDWGDRINHVHVKDVRLKLLKRVIAERAGMEAVWRWGTFCELGAGDVDIEGFLEQLRKRRFTGWLVVEQDRIPAPDEPVAHATDAQSQNRRFLRSWGL